MNKNSILISGISSFLYVTLRTRFYTQDLMQVDFALLGIGLILLFVYFFKSVRKKNEIKLLFYSLTSAFAVLHIFNYELSISYMPLLFVSILTYLILGFAFAFYRLKYGFLKALKIHIIYNIISVFGLLITTLMGYK